MSQIQDIQNEADVFIKVEGELRPRLDKLVESIIVNCGRFISLHTTFKTYCDVDCLLWEISAMTMLRKNDPRDIIALISADNYDHVIYLPYAKTISYFNVIVIEINDLPNNVQDMVFKKIHKYLREGKGVYIVVHGRVVGYYNELGEVYPDEDFNPNIKYKNVLYIGGTAESVVDLSEQNIVIWIHTLDLLDLI